MKPLYEIGIVLVLFVACNKSDVTQAPTSEPADAGPPLSFYVFEKDTKKPIAKAVASLKKCPRHDNEFGCQEYSTFKTAISDAADLVYFGRVKGYEGVGISHDRYFRFFANNISDFLPDTDNHY